MKKFLLLSVAVAMTTLLSVPTLAETGGELLSSADVYLTFEDGIGDANGNYSIYSDGDTPLVEGRFGSAANIQSGVNYLTVEEFLFESDSFTVTAWLNAHEHSGDPAIFATKSWAAGSNPGWVLAMESQTIKYNANTANGSRTDGVFAYAASSMESDIDTWYHIALSVDREEETYTFYINGVAMGTGNFAENGHSDESYDDPYNGYTFNIGEDGTGFYNMSQTLDCDFDEIAVFKGKALTEEEIVSIYTYAPEGYEASVVTEKALEPLTYTADPSEVLASADLHITFEDGTVDTTGHYTVTSNGTTPSVDGISGKAANVTNGVNSLIVENFAVGTDSFTVTSWLNLHALSGDPVIFGNKDWASGSNPGWLICTADAIGGAKVSYNANVEGGSRVDVGYNLSLTMGTNCYDNWFHIALVVDRTEQTCTMYINGRQQGNPSSFAENNHTDISYDTALPFYIGDDGTGSYNASYTINCDFDEIAIFKRALTADEIAAIYCSISPEYAETAAPEAVAPETAAPETTAPETAAPETAAPETAAPETAIPETAAPETAAPEENAPQTFDAGILAAVAAVVTLAGAAVAKKRR